MGIRRDKLEALSDEKLVKKSQKEDEIAFEVLMERHSTYILASALQCRKRHDVDDILQVTYIKCWQKIKTFKFKSSFKTWIFRVLRNNHYDLARRECKRREKEIIFSDLKKDDDYKDEKVLDYIQGSDIVFSSDELPSSRMEQEEKAVRLNGIFNKIKNKLSPTQVKTMELVLEKEMTYQEAAKEMNCSVGTIMSRLFYARKRAQKIIKEHYEKI